MAICISSGSLSRRHGVQVRYVEMAEDEMKAKEQN